MNTRTSLPVGQHEARTRWGTHESGAAFDRKKTSYLTRQAQDFIVQQAFCVIAGIGPQKELYGLLAMAEPGFVRIVDNQTCIIQLKSRNDNIRFFQRVGRSPYADLGLFFICHPARERLCVQGTAELRLDHLPGANGSTPLPDSIWVRLHVRQAFFHCTKYIRTRVAGLTAPVPVPFEQKWHPQQLLGCRQTYLSKEVCAFINQQVLCFLCTVDRHGQCAVNHRGGAPGFLVPLPPDEAAPGGRVLLPDYTGNGAFEAIGNIVETGKATIVIPNYAAQLALCVSGSAQVLELEKMPRELAQRCVGAERVVALAVERVEAQSGDWSTTLAYERARAESIGTMTDSMPVCAVYIGMS